MLLLFPSCPKEWNFIKVLIIALLPPRAGFQDLPYDGVIVTPAHIEALKLKTKQLLLILELSNDIGHPICLVYGAEEHLINFIP